MANREMVIYDEFRILEKVKFVTSHFFFHPDVDP